LETTIESTTKKITEVKEKIESYTVEINTCVSQREDLKNQLKIVAVTEKSKIQEQIDKLTTDCITSKKKEVETWTTEREDYVTEETTARTELTFTSQSLKQVTVEKEKIEEQITVTQVVIDSKKEETTE
jgi:chromosome segregation ATPase